MNVAAIDQDRANAGTPVRSGKPMRILIPDKMVEKKPDQFASALAHEIRNPLTNINLAAEMLQSTLIAKDQKIYLDIIMRASERINDLTADLLSYYQTDEVRVEICSVHQLLDDALATTMDRIRLKHIIIKKQYTLLDAQILVNKQPMKIALANMIINAIEAMPSKNGQLSLVTKSMDGQCIVEIKDNGAGISKEDLRHIFEPYFTNKPGGMGLGLSTTLNILRSNHAIVEVQSAVGAGTNFILSFNKVS